MAPSLPDCPLCEPEVAEVQTTGDGIVICGTCGTVITDAQIVNEISFGENAAGAAAVHGTLVSGATGRHSIRGPGARQYGDGNSRAVTLQRGEQPSSQTRENVV